ncbi:MAG: carbohydrate-binding protein [Flavisolibacter sp.]
MRHFAKLFLLVLVNTSLFSFCAQSQSILDPTDPVITYDSTNPPVQPPWGQIGKWVRTKKRVSWNTDGFKAYIYKGVCFRLKFPKTYNPAVNDGKKYPMLVFFHGLGEAAPITDNEDQLYWGADFFNWSVDNGTFDGYLLFMQSQGFWGGGHYDYTKEIVDYMVANNKLDPFHVTLNGLSAGGQAVWEMFFKYPTYAAAALPMVSCSIWYRDTADVNKMKFTPFWNTHGGLDGSPAPSTCEQVRDAMLAAGGNYRNTLYPDVAHFTWPNTWNEPDFWPFMNRAYASNPWPLGGKTDFCNSTPINTTIGLAPGFDAYQWRKDGVIINGAATNTLQVTQTGSYDARVQRGGIWSDWSHTPVVIKTISCAELTAPPAGYTRIEAENLTGGSGVQSETTLDAGGGSDMTWQDAGDWMDYSVNIPLPGTYTVHFRVASLNTSAAFQLKKDSTVLTTLNVPVTGGSQTFQTISAQVTLPAGQQTLRIQTKASGWNLNWWEINGTPAGSSASNPLKIEAENYSAMSGIQTETTPDVGGGQDVGWQDNNDWMDYSISVPNTGTYTINYRVATINTGAQFQLRKADGTVLSTVTIPSTGGWQAWQTISSQVNLTQGVQTLRIFTNNSAGGWNLNWFQLYLSTAAAPLPNVAPSANAGSAQTITLPVSSVTLNGSGTDSDGTIQSYAWSQVSGPSTATIGSPAAASTQVSGLIQGSYVFRLTVKDNAGATGTSDVTVTVNPSVPVGNPSSLHIEAESWTSMSGVYKEPTSDLGGGYDLGSQDLNDWADYSVNIPSTGSYTLNFRIATMVAGAQFQLRRSDGTVIATVSVPSTGAYQNWQTISTTATLAAGQQTVRIYTIASPGGWNLNWWEIVAGGGTPTNIAPTVSAGTDQTITLPASSTQLTGTASDADGTIASYAWTQVSGPSTASFNSTTTVQSTISNLVAGVYTFRLTVKDNSGASASDDVVVTVNAAVTGSNFSLHIEAENWSAMSGVYKETTSDVGGGYNLGSQDLNDWAEYAVNIPTTGTYTLRFRIATMVAGAQFQLRRSNGTVITTMSVPSTGTYQTWQTISTTANLTAGQQTLRIYTTASPAGWNLNWWEILSGTVAAAARSGVLIEQVNPVVSAMGVYPNPTTDAFQLIVNNSYSGNLRVQVINESGMVVKVFNLNKTMGNWKENLQVGELQRGAYIIRTSMNGWVGTTRLIKK